MESWATALKTVQRRRRHVGVGERVRRRHLRPRVEDGVGEVGASESGVAQVGWSGDDHLRALSGVERRADRAELREGDAAQVGAVELRAAEVNTSHLRTGQRCRAEDSAAE